MMGIIHDSVLTESRFCVTISLVVTLEHVYMTHSVVFPPIPCTLCSLHNDLFVNCVWTTKLIPQWLTVYTGEPGLSSQVLSPQSNPGASPGGG